MRRHQNVRWFFLALIVLIGVPQLVHAGIKWKTVREVKLESRALDVTASSDGELIFALSPGKILVYSAAEDTIIDRIPVDSIYTRITYSNDERLVLSATDPATLQILKYDRVYDINITNRPFRGPKNAKVTLVIFDDYQ